MSSPIPEHQPDGMEQGASPLRAGHLRRRAFVLLILICLGLLASSVYRAATFPFAHDESLSFSIFRWEPGWRGTANHHRLNTALMRLCSILFGDSEISLRLPNLAAHAAYLWGSVLLLRRFPPLILQAAGFVLLNLNPFVLDFFCLARGYGLALAFLMWSLYFLMRAFESGQASGFERFLVLAQFMAALAVLANFSFLNYYLPLLVASAYLLLRREVLPALNFRVARTLTLFVLHGVFLAVVLKWLFRLRRRQELYFGGTDGFVSDTIGSLVRTTAYSASCSAEQVHAISMVVVGLFIASALICVLLNMLRSGTPLYTLLVFLVGSAAALPVLQHRLFSTRFPIERAALLYIPLYTALMLATLHVLTRLTGRWGRWIVLAPVAVVTAGLGVHFAHRFDCRYSYTFPYDANNYAALGLIEKDREKHVGERSVRLGICWVFEPSMNFYRVTRDCTWLAPLRREPIQGESSDYIYTYERDIESLPRDRLVRLASYRDTETVLFRVLQPSASMPGP